MLFCSVRVSVLIIPKPFFHFFIHDVHQSYNEMNDVHAPHVVNDQQLYN
jgi:hypothetical protein